MDLANLTPRITETVQRLRNEGLAVQDRQVLAQRLVYLWVERHAAKESSKSKWRNDIARQGFNDVRCKSVHLFFVLLLLVTPTQCGQRTFYDSVIKPLLNSESYAPYSFSLSLHDKQFLENTAKAKGFLKEPDFIALLQALFPEDDRTFTYAYSKIPRNNIPMFLRIMAEGMEKSNLYLGEMERGDQETSAATVLIPAGDVDCHCSIVVSRPVITEALRELRLTKVYEQGSAPLNR